MNRSALGILAVATLVAATAGAVNSSFADSPRPTLKRAPGVERQLYLRRNCAPGFSIVRRTRTAYDCRLTITPTCRKKYEALRKFPPYIIRTKNPPWLVYVCHKTKPGHSGGNIPDCVSGFSKVGAVPNSHYRCYRRVKPRCRPGYKPYRLTRGFLAQGAKITEVNYRYTCKKI